MSVSCESLELRVSFYDFTSTLQAVVAVPSMHCSLLMD